MSTDAPPDAPSRRAAPSAPPTEVAPSHARTQIHLGLRFLVSTTIVAAVVPIVAGVLVARELGRALLERSERHAIHVARHLEIELAAARTAGWERRRIDACVRHETAALGIVEIKLYREDGTLLYSLASPDLENTPVTGNRHLDRARGEGVIDTRLIAAGARSHSEATGLAQPIPTLESYVPVFASGGTGPYAVLEIYQDASELQDQAWWTMMRVALGSLGAIAALGLLLYASVRTANWTIRRQTRELTLANERLHELRGELEAKVAVRSQQLVGAEKLAGLGRLAAGVAHEINTPLASIAVCAEGLLRELDRGTPVAASDRLREDLAIVRDEAFRGKEIIQALLSAARSNPLRLRSVDPVELVRRTISLVQLQRCTVPIALAPSAPGPITADPDQLQQVLLNVTTNAVDACRDGGRVEWSAIREGPSVVLSCVDTGSGVAREHQGAVFDPFFTTKEPGQGTGLGLATSYRIVTDHGGRIELASDGPGRGTRVTITLPAEVAGP